MNAPREQLAVVAPSAPGSPDGSATQTTRDRLAVRSPRLDQDRPAVLDLEQELLDALSGELRGVASLLADGSPVHYREALRGERHLHLADVCRLALSDRPEARRAYAILVDRLQQLRDRPDAPIENLHELLAGFAEQTADVTAAGTRALQDGQLDDAEDRRLAAEIAEAEAAIASLKDGLAEHRRARRSVRRRA